MWSRIFNSGGTVNDARPRAWTLRATNNLSSYVLNTPSSYTELHDVSNVLHADWPTSDNNSLTNDNKNIEYMFQNINAYTTYILNFTECNRADFIAIGEIAYYGIDGTTPAYTYTSLSENTTGFTSTGTLGTNRLSTWTIPTDASATMYYASDGSINAGGTINITNFTQQINNKLVIETNTDISGKLVIMGDISINGQIFSSAGGGGGGGGGTTCAFSAWVSGSGGNQSTSGVFPANAERYDLGGNYNTSNYTFTAPVAGIYNFKYGVYSNETSSSSQSRIALLVNDTVVQFRGSGYPPYNWGNQISMDVELAANDTVKWSADSGYNIYYLETTNSNNTFFSGHLVKETT